MGFSFFLWLIVIWRTYWMCSPIDLCFCRSIFDQPNRLYIDWTLEKHSCVCVVCIRVCVTYVCLYMYIYFNFLVQYPKKVSLILFPFKLFQGFFDIFPVSVGVFLPLCYHYFLPWCDVEDRWQHCQVVFNSFENGEKKNTHHFFFTYSIQSRNGFTFFTQRRGESSRWI